MNETWWINAGQLDDEQKQILKADPEDSLLITGPPGSGKTNILILRANYVRSRAPRLLFVTFTRTLAEFLKSGPSIGRADQLKASDIMTFMSWGISILRDAKRPISLGGGSFNSKRNKLVEALKLYISEDNPGRLYDVVFVDEVQDFTKDELVILRRFCTFINGAGDSRQAIWNHKEGLPAMKELSTKDVELRYHYRIGRKICTFADRILPPKEGDPTMIDGCKYDEVGRPSSVTPVHCPDRNAQFVACIEAIRSQLRYIADEPILVMSHTKATRDAFWGFLENEPDLEAISVLQSSEGYEAFGPNSLIRVMTIASAKGSEARAVHILGASKLGSSLRELAFTAVTRAKTEVALYHTGMLPGHLTPPAEVLPDLDDIF